MPHNHEMQWMFLLFFPRSLFLFKLNKTQFYREMIIIPCVCLPNAELDRDYVKFALTAYDILHMCEAEMGGLFFN